MKLKILVFATAVAFSGMAVAADPTTPAVPQTPEAWAQSVWDFTRNPNPLKDPKQFVPFATAATEPGFYAALGTQMMDPSMWAYMANSIMNPAAYSAWMPLMTDPNVYMKWLTASMDPNFYTALLAQFSDPGKLMRWLMSPVDPRTMAMFMQTINPAMYLKWMMAPLDPQWLRAGINTMNPGMYLGWLGAGLNPTSYGDLWKGLLTYPVPGAPAPTYTSPYGTTFNIFDPNAWTQMFAVPGVTPTLTPPAGGATAQPYVFNPFDPNVWAKMWQVPGQPAAAPAATPPAK
ncbi:MAG: hypothetical protein FD187_2067 [bacterium]|nr:MAG: hypothetical protein FD142_1096 [bacterium]KAF0148381.1 MAG: hypothetical protein FD187_2067 [bacterium]KAF0166046.1 MAG: hypothetical protein FD158_2724 [bacterium]TXT20189.1 MAG: hypothetical protein FD132_1412 [bacterium]